jgi:Concanavalin A-like lectin/glucanases superfamily
MALGLFPLVLPLDFAAGSWHHFAATWYVENGGLFLTVYIDGAAQGSSASSPASLISMGSNVYIGGEGVSGRPYFGMGKMDEVKLWSYVRSETEIQKSMVSCTPNNATGLAGYWTFEENNGSTILPVCTISTPLQLEQRVPIGCQAWRVARTAPLFLHQHFP